MDKPFRTDGCTLWPDGDWKDCCVEHDRAYWRGGRYRARLAADRALFRCVRARAGFAVALVMYVGVRVFGAFYWPFPWRWGYGYRWPRWGP